MYKIQLGKKTLYGSGRQDEKRSVGLVENTKNFDHDWTETMDWKEKELNLL